jgi:EpsI family protein
MENSLEFLKTIKVRRLNLIVCLIILSLFFVGFKSMIYNDVEHEPRLNFKNFPINFGDWKGKDSAGLDIRSLDILKLSNYATRTYTDSKGRMITLYIGYWANQTGEYQAAKHSPALCLPSNGWQTLHLDNINLTKDQFNFLDKDIPIRRVIGTKRSNKDLFYYWFFSGTQYYSQEWYAIFKLSMSNLFFGRSDGGIIEISAEITGNKSFEENLKLTDETIKDFVKDFFPHLHQTIVSEK